MKIKLFTLFVALTLGNLLAAGLFNVTLHTIFERSFFQGVALFCAYLLLKPTK